VRACKYRFALAQHVRIPSYRAEGIIKSRFKAYDNSARYVVQFTTVPSIYSIFETDQLHKL
jgi:hypothetical protein